MHPLIVFPGWLPQHPSMNCPMETLNAYAQVDWVLYARRLQKRCLSLFQCTCVCVCLSLSLCLCLSLSLSVSLSVSVSVHDLSVRVCAMAGQVAWWVLVTRHAKAVLDRLARHTCPAPWRGPHVWLCLHLPAAHTSSLQAPPQPEVNSTQVSLWFHLPTVQVRHAGWHWVLCTLHYTFNYAWTVFTTVCEM